MILRDNTNYSKNNYMDLKSNSFNTNYPQQTYGSTNKCTYPEQHYHSTNYANNNNLNFNTYYDNNVSYNHSNNNVINYDVVNNDSAFNSINDNVINMSKTLYEQNYNNSYSSIANYSTNQNILSSTNHYIYKIKTYIIENHAKLILYLLFITVICSVIWGISAFNNRPTVTESQVSKANSQPSQSGTVHTQFAPSKKEPSNQNIDTNDTSIKVPTEEPNSTLEDTNINENQELSNDEQIVENTSNPNEETAFSSNSKKENTDKKNNNAEQTIDNSSSTNNNNIESNTKEYNSNDSIENQTSTEEPTPQKEPETITTSIKKDSSWMIANSYNYIFSFTICNNGDTPVSNWSATIALPSNGGQSHTWNAYARNDDKLIHIMPTEWSQTILPNSELTFNVTIFCDIELNENNLVFTVNK